MMSNLVTAHLQRLFTKVLLIVAAVILVLQIGIIVINTIVGGETEGAFTSTFDTFSVVMIIFGIITVYPHLNRLAFHGVTRKNYLKGTIEAAIKATFLALIIALLFIGLEYIAIKVFQLPFDETIRLGGFGDNLLIASIGFYLSLLTTFFIGWAIGLAFYKFDWIVGTIAIIISMFLFGLLDYFWENEFVQITIYGISFDSFWESHLIVSLIGTLVLIVGLLTIIRNLVRNIALN
ncbi:hypothetical protein ACFFJI_04840 [Allobacillus sp. GCM10007491]|uniref:Uncharacterized protein n=1 Tax=Allobacillus saliphilus TaxID=2912308 RepID=A0A941HT53_9BACI|nr:hypothetical protein [Allobacillus saliphilus]MBR7554078.1 hypothetical protein [Allobacillus saliphilus]